MDMDAYLVEAKRTPIGRSHAEKGAFRATRADELLGTLLRYFADHVVDPREVDDLYVGCVGQHLEQGKNVARLAALLAGYPDTVPGVTINRLCGSSLQAFNFAAAALGSGQADVLLAGGVEHMHHVPMTAALDYNQHLLDRYEFPFTNMGLTAERVAERFRVSREAQDEFALTSHRRAVEAQESGAFDREIVPVATPHGQVVADQTPRRDTSLEALRGLKPLFREGGSVTAGNSSPLNDGASLTLLATGAACRLLDLTPRAQVVGCAVVGLDPLEMGLGPVPAIAALLERQGLRAGDIDQYEVNEAFAAQAIASTQELGLPLERVNPDGGAIALGHPLGASGTRLVTTLLHGLERRHGRLGVAAMCIGHGQGIATLIRRKES
jgi:acetyl-CoA acetyltransferase family protein